jgi:hypothetical protein
LPPVSTTPAVPVGKFPASVVDNGGKFSAGVTKLLKILMKIILLKLSNGIQQIMLNVSPFMYG